VRVFVVIPAMNDVNFFPAAQNHIRFWISD
jgi:hypothetical protein